MPNIEHVEFDREKRLSINDGGDIQTVLSNQAEDGVLHILPEGDYLSGSGYIVDENRFGLKAEGDTTISIPQGSSHSLVDANYIDAIALQGFTIDQRPNDRETFTEIGAQAKNGAIVSVDYVGRGMTGINAACAATSKSGLFVVKDCDWLETGYMDEYGVGNGRIGVWAGLGHQGVLKVDNMRIGDLGNNGMYTSRCPGDVRVTNSFFKNNNASNIRIGGDGSYAKNCYILIDHADYALDVRSDLEKGFNHRGIQIEQKKNVSSDRMRIKEGKAVIENCKIEIKNVIGGYSNGAIEIAFGGRGAIVRDTDITVEADGVHAVFRRDPTVTNIRDDVGDTPKPWGLEMYNSTIRNRGGKYAIWLRKGDGTRIEDSCIESDSPLLFLEDTDGVTIKGDVETNAPTLIDPNSHGNANINVDPSEVMDLSCPQRGLESGDGADEGDPEKEIAIIGEVTDPITYTFVVRGEVTSTDLNQSDSVTELGAGLVEVSGVVEGGTDSFRHTGCIQAFDVSDMSNVMVSRDGRVMSREQIETCSVPDQGGSGAQQLAVGLGLAAVSYLSESNN